MPFIIRDEFRLIQNRGDLTTHLAIGRDRLSKFGNTITRHGFRQPLRRFQVTLSDRLDFQSLQFRIRSPALFLKLLIIRD